VKSGGFATVGVALEVLNITKEDLDNAHDDVE
jgi:hypothetical protein